MITRQQTQEAYAAGRKCRSVLESQEECPFGQVEVQLRCWWMAGWNDKDMEASQ